MGIRLWAWLLVLMVTTGPMLGKGKLLLRGEDVLFSPNIELSADQRSKVEELLKQRRELLGRLEIDTIEEKMTAFGLMTKEVKELQDWRKNEDRQLRKLLSSTVVRTLEKRVKELEPDLKATEETFPLLSGQYFGLEQGLEQSAEGESTLKVIVFAKVPSNKYALILDEESVRNGTLTLKVTVLRPNAYELLEENPKTVRVDREKIFTGVLPKKIQFWIREVESFGKQEPHQHIGEMSVVSL